MLHNNSMGTTRRRTLGKVSVVWYQNNAGRQQPFLLLGLFRTDLTEMTHLDLLPQSTNLGRHP